MDHRLSRDELIDLAASRSYVITLPDTERAAVLARVAPGRSRPGLAETGELALPYVTECYRADRADPPAAWRRPGPRPARAARRRRASTQSVGTPAYRDSVIMFDGSGRDGWLWHSVAAARARLGPPWTPILRRRPLSTLDFVVVDVETTAGHPTRTASPRSARSG